LLPDPSLSSSIAPSIALWSIAWTMYRSFYCFLIHRLQHPSLLQLFAD
jgi:hypothetical protein